MRAQLRGAGEGRRRARAGSRTTATPVIDQLQRQAGNRAVSRVVGAPLRVQRSSLALSNGREVGNTGPPGSNQRSDVMHVLDRLHVLWAVTNDQYRDQLQDMRGDPVDSDTLGILSSGLERGIEGSIAPAVAQNLLAVKIEHSVGPGLTNAAGDLGILSAALVAEGLSSDVEKGLSQLKTRVIAGRRQLGPPAHGGPSGGKTRAKAKPLSAGLVTPTPAERKQIDMAGPSGFSSLPEPLRGKVQVEKTLKRAGINDPADWYSDFVEASFLGVGTGDAHGIHPHLQSRLEAAEDSLREQGADSSFGVHANDTLKGYRAPPDGLHTFGLAVDINYKTNPAISAATWRAVSGAGLLLHQIPEDQNPIQHQAAGVAGGAGNYETLRAGSKDFVDYIALLEDAAALPSLVTALNAAGKDPLRGSVEAWRARIARDKAAATKDFVMSNGAVRDMSKGFLDLDRRVVDALKHQGLTWLGDFAAYQDIQHFSDTKSAVKHLWSGFDSAGGNVWKTPV